MIEIKQLTKRYKEVEVLKDINLSIPDGEVLALLGHNGSGKSTLIKSIVGVLKSTIGTVEIDGRDSFEHRKKIISQMGVVFNQKPSFIIDISVYDNLEFYKAVYELSDDTFYENLKLIDQYLHIMDLYHKPYRKLSFGERVKCEIASVLLHAPKYIILDEPTIGLDYNAKKGLYDLLVYLQKRDKTTIIIITHEVDYIEDICTRAVILNKGVVCYDGTPKTISEHMRKTCKVKVRYNKIRKEEEAKKILDAVDEKDSKKKEFCIHCLSESEKNDCIRQINEAFDILELSTGTASLREVFEVVLQEIQKNK